MGFLLQPWFLILFAIAGFFVFRTLGAKEKYSAEVAMLPLTRWVMVGIIVMIATLGVLKALQDPNLKPSRSGTEIAPATVR